MNLLVVGHGYSAQAFVARAGHRFARVSVTTTRAERAAELAARGLDAHLFSGGSPSAALAGAAQAATHVVVSTPPGPEGDPALAAFGDRFAASRTLRWLAYLSTLGVYGDHGGAWVAEDTPCAPSEPRTRARMVAETGWRDCGARAGWRIHILRLAGIYGPGRSAIDQIRAGAARRIVKPGQVFNRIHVDDIAGALECLLNVAEGGLWNVADDEPAPPQDVVAYAARLLGVPLPPEIPFESAELSPMAARFYAQNRRASNRRLRRAGWAPAYPTYREGLAAILRAEAI